MIYCLLGWISLLSSVAWQCRFSFSAMRAVILQSSRPVQEAQSPSALTTASSLSPIEVIAAKMPRITSEPIPINIKVTMSQLFDSPTCLFQIFPEVRIRLTDYFWIVNTDVWKSESQRCESHCHSMVFVGVDDGLLFRLTSLAIPE